MAATDDLKAGQAAVDAGVAALGTEVSQVVTFIQALAAQLGNAVGGVSQSDAEAVSADLNTQATALQNAVAALQGAITPAPAPAPVEPPVQG